MDPQGVGLLKGKVFTNRSGSLVNPNDIADIPENSCILILKKDHKENNHSFNILLFCDSDKKKLNSKSLPVTYYDHAWYSFAQAADSAWIQLIEVLSHIHNYDLGDQSSTSSASDSTVSIDKTIRNSPAVLSITNSPKVSTLTQLPKMATTTTMQTQATTQTTTSSGSTQLLSAAELHLLLHMAIQGGGGGEGGGGGGGGQPAAAQQPLQPVTAAANVKAMGANPPLFTGNQDKADNFILKVEEYLLLNNDVAGFNSPQKKVTLTLMFMQGPEVAEWTHGIRAWLLQLTPAQNTDNIWTEFLVEFETCFQDTQAHQKCHDLFSFLLYNKLPSTQEA